MANKERVRLLVEALRSGEHEQARGHLEAREDGKIKRCCLGVACRVAMANGLELKVNENDGWANTLFNGQDDVLPHTVAEWFDFYDTNPTVAVLREGDWVSATRANDSLRLNFAEIANAFERQYLSDEETPEPLTMSEWLVSIGVPPERQNTDD